MNNEVNATLLTVTQFAAAANVKPGTVRVWAASRKITSVKLGRALRIPASELGRLIELGIRPAITHTDN